MGSPIECESCADTTCSAKSRRADEEEQDFLDRQQLAMRMCRIKHKIMILSGKGGVGKSTVAVNIDGGLAVALTVLRLDPEFGDFAFAIARSCGLAAHIVEERKRERPMRLIDPTSVDYDGVAIPRPPEED